MLLGNCLVYDSVFTIFGAIPIDFFAQSVIGKLLIWLNNAKIINDMWILIPWHNYLQPQELNVIINVVIWFYVYWSKD